MYVLMPQPTAKVRNITRTAERRIRQITGIDMHLMVPTTEVCRSPQRMLHVIALALDMDPNAFKEKTRVRDVVEMRFLGALFLRQNYPTLTLQQIARLFGGQDHTSVVSGLARAYSLLRAGDERFREKYNTVLNSVNSWLKREA